MDKAGVAKIVRAAAMAAQSAKPSEASKVAPKAAVEHGAKRASDKASASKGRSTYDHSNSRETAKLESNGRAARAQDRATHDKAAQTAQHQAEQGQAVQNQAAQNKDARDKGRSGGSDDRGKVPSNQRPDAAKQDSAKPKDHKAEGEQQAVSMAQHDKDTQKLTAPAVADKSQGMAGRDKAAHDAGKFAQDNAARFTKDVTPATAPASFKGDRSEVAEAARRERSEQQPSDRPGRPDDHGTYDHANLRELPKLGHGIEWPEATPKDSRANSSDLPKLGYIKWPEATRNAGVDQQREQNWDRELTQKLIDAGGRPSGQDRTPAENAEARSRVGPFPEQSWSQSLRDGLETIRAEARQDPARYLDTARLIDSLYVPQSHDQYDSMYVINSSQLQKQGLSPEDVSALDKVIRASGFAPEGDRRSDYAIADDPDDIRRGWTLYKNLTEKQADQKVADNRAAIRDKAWTQAAEIVWGLAAAAAGVAAGRTSPSHEPVEAAVETAAVTNTEAQILSKTEGAVASPTVESPPPVAESSPLAGEPVPGEGTQQKGPRRTTGSTREDIQDVMQEEQSRGRTPDQPEGTHAVSKIPNPRTSVSSSPSEILGQSLRERKVLPSGPGQHAHHIVPEGMLAAAKARRILERSGIGINEAQNGVWLPGSPEIPNPQTGAVHSYIHTSKYVETLTQQLSQAEQQGTVAQTLKTIQDQIQSGRFTH